MESKDILTALGIIKFDCRDNSKHYIKFSGGTLQRKKDGIEVFIPKVNVEYLSLDECERLEVVLRNERQGEPTPIKQEGLYDWADPVKGSLQLNHIRCLETRLKVEEEEPQDAEDCEEQVDAADNSSVCSHGTGDHPAVDCSPTHHPPHIGALEVAHEETEEGKRRPHKPPTDGAFRDSFSTASSNGVTTYRCRLCGAGSTTRRDILKHFKISHFQWAGGSGASSAPSRRHNKRGKHRCGECGGHFPTLKELRLHVSIHRSGEREFGCDKCSKKFYLKDDLVKHRVVHEVDKPHQCEKCPSSYATLKKLESHQAVHSGVRSFECNICSKKFYQSVNLMTHLIIHNEDKKLQCDVCGRKYIGKHGLKLHKMTHSKEKPHSCDVCGKTFTTKPHLREHYRRHTGEKPYACHLCAQKFAQKQTLRRHMKVNHSDGEPHVCSVCGKSFPILNSLTKHKKTHYESSKKHQCPHCDMRFIDNNHLQRHLMVHTGETPFECSVCGKKFTQKSNMRSHMRVHTK